MSKNNADTLNERFSNVLKELKNKGVSQRKIMVELELDFITDETYFSSIKSGKRKNIPDDLIRALHQKFNINPAYLKMESDCIFDTNETKIENFMRIIDDWNVLKSDSNEYLHLTINKNVVDLLIELYKVKKVTDEGISSFEQEKESLKELYNADPDPKEYVLILQLHHKGFSLGSELYILGLAFHISKAYNPYPYYYFVFLLEFPIEYPSVLAS